jgi:hypothetical protein
MKAIKDSSRLPAARPNQKPGSFVGVVTPTV